MQRIELENFYSTRQVIEEEFGSEWLHGKILEAKQGQPLSHPVPFAWAHIVQLLREYEETNQLRKTGGMIRLSVFGDALAVARKLPNFHSVLPYRPRDETEFPKAEYEVFVAAWWSQAGHHVEFIPTQPKQRTPDIRAKIGNNDFFIECKSRDAYNIQQKTAEDGEGWKSLDFALVDLLKDKEIESGLELFVLIPREPATSAVEAIVREIKNKLDTGFRGGWTGRQAGYLLREPVTPIVFNQSSLFLPSWQNPGSVFGTIAIDSKGQRYFKNPVRIAFFTINSYKLSAVKNSFDDARQQLPRNATGLIYINLDVSNLDSEQADIYADLVASSLATQFNPKNNTRIAAVVVTTEPQFIHRREGDKDQLILSRFVRIARNPYRPFPDGIPIPPENRDS